MFEHLHKYEIREKVVEFKLVNIEGEPVLKLAPATEANREYFRELLRLNKVNIRRANRVIDDSIMRDNLAKDRILYAQYIVVGWVGVKDGDGNLVTFSKENVAAFLQALPDWVFNQIRSFASEPENFVEGDEEAMLGN